MSKALRNFFRLSIKTGLGCASALILTTLLPYSLPAAAIEFPDGQTAFDRAPRLIRTAASFRGRRNRAATYHFTIEVPSDAGEALKAVKISQRENFSETISFKPSENRAFIGDSFAGGPALSLAPVGGTSKPGTFTVVFDQPVPPGSTVTVALKPERNPFTGGVYLFGVTAYPEGEDSIGLYLGSGRIQINHD